MFISSRKGSNKNKVVVLYICITAETIFIAIKFQYNIQVNKTIRQLGKIFICTVCKIVVFL